MKIAFTSQGETLDSPMDVRFGRAKNFIVYNTDNKTFETIPNTQNLNAAQGAGIQAASNVAATNAEIVVTGHCGPKAFKVLQVANIKVYTTSATSVADALKAFENNELNLLSEADVNGHWI